MARTKQTARKRRPGERLSAQERRRVQQLLREQALARGEELSSAEEITSDESEGPSEEASTSEESLDGSMEELADFITLRALDDIENDESIDEESRRVYKERKLEILERKQAARDEAANQEEPTVEEEVKAWIRMQKEKLRRIKRKRAEKKKSEEQEAEAKKKLKGKDKAVPIRKLKKTPTVGIVIRDRQPDQPPSSDDDDDEDYVPSPRRDQEEGGSFKPADEDQAAEDQTAGDQQIQGPPPYPTWEKKKDPKKPTRPARESYVVC